MQLSHSAQLYNHEQSIAILLARQHEIVRTLESELSRARAMPPIHSGGELELMLQEQIETIGRSHHAACEQVSKIAWMLATARDMRALASGPSSHPRVTAVSSWSVLDRCDS